MPGQECGWASDPPTTRSSSTVDVFVGPAPQVDCLLDALMAFSLTCGDLDVNSIGWWNPDCRSWVIVRIFPSTFPSDKMLSPAGCLQQTSETSKQRRVDELYSMLEKWEEGSTNASLPFFHLFPGSGKPCGWLRKFLNYSKWATAVLGYDHCFFLLLLPWLCHWIICWLHT